jgi:hypothetical protein
LAQKNAVTKPDMPMDEDTKIVTYKGVVELSGVTRSELYKRAYNFFKSYYAKYTANTITVNDSVNGRLEAKAQFPTYKTLKNGVKTSADLVQYTFTIDVKDGKYRYTITKINIKAASYKPIETYFSDTDPNKEEHWSTLTQADDNFNKMVGDMREGMEKPSNKVKKDDW